MQSALHPAGPAAQSIFTLTCVMTLAAALIMVLVVALTVYAMRARGERRWLSSASSIVVGGLVFPIVVLSALLVYGLVLARELIAPSHDALRIEVTAQQWWWRVRYLDAQGMPQFETANEIRIPTDRAIDLTLESADVIHSFWIPALAGKIDTIPGHVNRLRLSAAKSGTFRGQCAEYCGGAHAMMALYVVADNDQAFAQWMQRQRAPAQEPADAHLQSGRALFLSSGCIACHTIRGTPAAGYLGPDLTHVGSRLSIAAGSFPNHAGTFAGWIADSQRAKPGNHMPSFPMLLGVELRALAAYLESLQ